VIWRGALVGSRASTPLKFLLSHIFRETWRTCRALFIRHQLFPEMEKMLIEKVRQRTFLYDTKSPDYRDQHMRANAWEGTGKELKIKRKFNVSSRNVRIVCPRLNARLMAHLSISAGVMMPCCTHTANTDNVECVCTEPLTAVIGVGRWFNISAG